MNNSNTSRILVVDDNPDIHADFQKILAPPSAVASELAAAASELFNRAPARSSKPSFNLETASQGRDALEMVKSALAAGQPYEVAFVDMRMPPGWDGLETIAHLWEVQPNLLTIICTAYSDHSWEDINKRLNQSDRFLILKKPFDNVEVHQLASALTSRARVERELAESTRRLIETSRHAGMAEIATGVLHNVGNVLNSVNVSATLLADRIRRSKISLLSKTVHLLGEHQADLARFLTQDANGRQFPEFLKSLSEHLSGEQSSLIGEAEALIKNVEHIKEIVSMQQSYSKVAGLLEPVPPALLIEDALRLKAPGLARHRIDIVRDFGDVPPVIVDKHKTLQILINLVGNAKHAITHHDGPEKRLTLRIHSTGDGRVRIVVEDTGMGIPAANLTKIFQYGFTTKKEGHGYGLHSAANAAREMGGSLTASSEGPGRGAAFVLHLPAANVHLPSKAA
jgi:signal transduction histidine kinase